MEQEKKYTAKEAAIAVLNKAKEILSKKTASEDLKKAEDVTPPDHVEKQPAPADNANGNPGPGAEPQNYTENYKGHIKLAKFLGRVEAKRGSKKPKVE